MSDKPQSATVAKFATVANLRKVPSLKIIADDDAAEKLRELIKDADDGFRRVVKCGLYIEWIAANLPHGQLLAWIDAHCPDIPLRTIYNWRSIAKSLCEWSNLKFARLENLPITGDLLLDYPADKLPHSVRAAREKMDNALAASKTAKQLFLFLGFKQGEIGPNGYPKPKVGRRKGEGGASKQQRANAAGLDDEERINEKKTRAAEIADWLTEKSDDDGLGKLTAIHEQLDNVMKIARRDIVHGSAEAKQFVSTDEVRAQQYIAWLANLHRDGDLEALRVTPEFSNLNQAMETARGYIKHGGGK